MRLCFPSTSVQQQLAPAVPYCVLDLSGCWALCGIGGCLTWGTFLRPWALPSGVVYFVPCALHFGRGLAREKAWCGCGCGYG